MLRSWGEMGLYLFKARLIILSVFEIYSIAFLLLFKLETSYSTWFSKERDVRDQILLGPLLPGFQKTPMGPIGCSPGSSPWLSAAVGRNGWRRAGQGSREGFTPTVFSYLLFFNFKEHFDASSVVFGAVEREEARR